MSPNTSKTLKIVGVIAGLAIAGFFVYKYVIKPKMAAKSANIDEDVDLLPVNDLTPTDTEKLKEEGAKVVVTEDNKQIVVNPNPSATKIAMKEAKKVLLEGLNK